jgi:hypothetical protein
VPDNGCAWVRPLVVSDDEVIVFAQHMHEMRPLADQINSQNTTRAEVPVRGLIGPRASGPLMAGAARFLVILSAAKDPHAGCKRR